MKRPTLDVTPEHRTIVASDLLAAGCIQLAPKNKPFLLASGRKSPVYCDTRSLLGWPKQLKRTMEIATSYAVFLMEEFHADAVIGGETAGIPFATIVAANIQAPLAYVRKEPKVHGTGRTIEGWRAEGTRFLLVEDLLTDGGSKRRFMENIGQEKCKTVALLTIFGYGRPLPSDWTIPVVTLTTWKEILEIATKSNLWTRAEANEVQQFLLDSDAWNQTHG